MKNRIMLDDFKKFIFAALILSICANHVFSKKIEDLDNIMKPFMLKIDKEKIFISNQFFVSTYSRDKLEFLNKFGGKGQGPTEFILQPRIKILNNKLLVYTSYRSIFFSKNGGLLKQLKYDGEFSDINCVKDNYIVETLDLEPKERRFRLTNLVVLDSNFKEIKIIHSKRSSVLQQGEKKKSFLVSPAFRFQSFDGKIYVATDPEGKLIIDVFNHNGNLLRRIQKEYKLIKIPEVYKKRKLDEFKSHPVMKKRWPTLSRFYDFTFPEYFPAIEDFIVRDRKIYIKTFKYGKGGVEFLVLDLHGKRLASKFLPNIKTFLWDISNNHFYYLHENDDTEVWELHVIKIQ